MTDHVLLNTTEAATYCRCSRKTIRMYSGPGAEPRLQSIRLPSGLHFKVEWLDAWQIAYDAKRRSRSR